MYNEIDVIISLINELRATNSRLDKEAILKKYWQRKDFKEILEKLFHAVYDYDKQYYVTSANILKKNLLQQGIFFGKNYSYIWDLLKDLSDRLITGHAAIIAVQQFLKNKTEEQQQIYLNIIDKDLKCGLSEVTINKVCGNIIKTFDVTLAQKIDIEKDVLDSTWCIERKLDGTRCILIYKNENDIHCYSRKGKEFLTVQKIIDEIKGKLPNNTVLDGELCIVDDKGNEDFQSIIKVIKRKDYTIENPMYKVFDILQLADFEAKTSQETYFQRVNRLKTIFDKQTFKTLSLVNYETFSLESFERWDKMVKDNHWEGLMFRKDVEYEGKRNKHLLKYKMFMDEEFKVIGIEEGDAQEVINGIAHKIKCVGSLIIEYRGNKVNVGTGLSLEQRKRWYEHPEEIIGKIICVKFFESTQSQDGTWSLRFPVLKTVYGDERDI